MSFDWNKLDSYKVALDDGFELNETKNNVRLEIKREDVYIFKVYTHSFGFGFRIKKEEDKDWETFKKKVADYFLGGVE